MDLYQGRADLETKWNGVVRWDGRESLRGEPTKAHKRT